MITTQFDWRKADFSNKADLEKAYKLAADIVSDDIAQILYETEDAEIYEPDSDCLQDPRIQELPARIRVAAYLNETSAWAYANACVEGRFNHEIYVRGLFMVVFASEQIDPDDFEY